MEYDKIIKQKNSQSGNTKLHIDANKHVCKDLIEQFLLRLKVPRSLTLHNAFLWISVFASSY